MLPGVIGGSLRAGCGRVVWLDACGVSGALQSRQTSRSCCLDSFGVSGALPSRKTQRFIELVEEDVIVFQRHG